jgi:hypothetical protein
MVETERRTSSYKAGNASSARAQAVILVDQIREKLDTLEHTLTAIEQAEQIHEIQGRGRKTR